MSAEEAADHQLDPAGLDLPLACVPDRHLLGLEGEADPFRLARRERDAAEAAQLLDGARHARDRIAQVELDDLVAGDRAGVADGRRDARRCRLPAPRLRLTREVRNKSKRV